MKIILDIPDGFILALLNGVEYTSTGMQMLGKA